MHELSSDKGHTMGGEFRARELPFGKGSGCDARPLVRVAWNAMLGKGWRFGSNESCITVCDGTTGFLFLFLILLFYVHNHMLTETHMEQ